MFDVISRNPFFPVPFLKNKNMKKSILSVLRGHKVKRTGIHSKTKTSRLKTSKNYKKKYKGQGR